MLIRWAVTYISRCEVRRKTELEYGFYFDDESASTDHKSKITVMKLLRDSLGLCRFDIFRCYIINDILLFTKYYGMNAFMM